MSPPPSLRLLVTLTVVGAAILLGGCAGTSGLRSEAPVAAELDRRILLTIEHDDFSALGLSGSPEQRYLRRRGYGAVPRVIDYTLDQLAREYRIERKEGWPIESLNVYCEIFEVPEDLEVSAVIERLLADPRVDLAQPMNLFETMSSRYDDPYVALQAAMRELDIEQAHELATGKGVLVAVIDTAIDAGHPELRGRIGLARDLVGARRKATGAEVHGTAVAGIIVAAIDNSEGIVGIAPDSRIAALRACWSTDTHPGSAHCTSFTLARALETAIGVGAKVINMSLAGPEDPLLSRLLAAAIARGAVVVAAEPRFEDRPFPASHPGVIVAEASSAPRKAPAAYRLPAPAEEILTTTPNAGYAFFSGTSFAAAHLTGVIALLFELEPRLAASRIAELLTETTVHGEKGSSVNACLALERLLDGRVCERRIQTVGLRSP
jgi:hypothetical protein